MFSRSSLVDVHLAYKIKNVVSKCSFVPSSVLANTLREATTITRKKWKYSNDNIVTEKNKKVVSKRHLYDVLSFTHNRIAHRGRQITMKWITENYTGVNQKVVNIFVKMCRFHQEQKTISRVKPVKQPLQAQTFLSLLEIDLMDFRNCSCATQMGNKFH